jgi:hypothetical protein
MSRDPGPEQGRLRIDPPPIKVAQRLARGDASGPQQRALRPKNNALFSRSVINFLAGTIKQACPTAPHLTGMKRKTANIDIRVEPQLVEKIDAWRARQRVSPSRAAAIVYMLEHFLEHDLPELNAAWERLLSKA